MSVIKIANPHIKLTSEIGGKILNIIESGELTTGKYVKGFERGLDLYTGRRKCTSTVNSGTAALHLACECVKRKLKGEIDDCYIIAPSFSFNATANVILMAGFKPLFADVDDDGLITVETIKEVLEYNEHLNVVAIIGVHLYGNCFDVEKIKNEFPTLYIIEDCAQAAGLRVGDKHVGTIGDYGCFSFYSTKNMTTGEGGMVLSDEDDAIYIKQLRNHGIDNSNVCGSLQSMKYNQPYFGYNYRMCEINAVIGMQQLDVLDCLNSIRYTHATIYDEKINNDMFIKPTVCNEHVFHQYTLRIKENGDRFLNSKFKNYLDTCGIQSEIYYPEPLPLLKYYIKYGLEQYYKTGVDVYHCYKNAQKLSQTVISIPVHPTLSLDNLYYIISKINEYDYYFGNELWEQK